jgi:hypothetical protein
MESTLQKILKKKQMSLYRLQKLTGLPYATLHALASSQEKLLVCASSTLYLLADTLGVKMEDFFADGRLRIPARFASCFWDVDWQGLRQENTPFVIERLLERGDLAGLFYVEDHFSKEEIKEAAKTRRDFSPVTANFLAQQYHLPKEEMAYYRYHASEDWRK